MATTSSNSNTGLLNSLGSVKFDVNLTLISAIYLCLALSIPVIIYLIGKQLS